MLTGMVDSSSTHPARRNPERGLKGGPIELPCDPGRDCPWPLSGPGSGSRCASVQPQQAPLVALCLPSIQFSATRDARETNQRKLQAKATKESGRVPGCFSHTMDLAPPGRPSCPLFVQATELTLLASSPEPSNHPKPCGRPRESREHIHLDNPSEKRHRPSSTDITDKHGQQQQLGKWRRQ